MRQTCERPLSVQFGLIVAEKRKCQGISQEDLAERVGITQVALARMEKGDISPKFERLRRFADALNCSVADLFPGTKCADETAACLAGKIGNLGAPAQKEIIGIVTSILKICNHGA